MALRCWEKRGLIDHMWVSRLTYDTGTDDETMEEPAAMNDDDDGEDVMEDYFSISSDWYDDLIIGLAAFCLIVDAKNEQGERFVNNMRAHTHAANINK